MKQRKNKPKRKRTKYLEPQMKFNPGTMMYHPDVDKTFPDAKTGNKYKEIKAKKSWWLGFLGFLGFLGIPELLTQDWLGALWLIWFLWFLLFLPKKREYNNKRV